MKDMWLLPELMDCSLLISLDPLEVGSEGKELSANCMCASIV